MRKRKAVKTKKALKRLDRVEELLSKLLDQYAADESGVRELLHSGRAAVAGARAKAKTPAKESSRSKVKAAVKKKAVVAAKQPRKTMKKARRPVKAKRPPTRSLKSQSPAARDNTDTSALANAI